VTGWRFGRKASTYPDEEFFAAGILAKLEGQSERHLQLARLVCLAGHDSKARRTNIRVRASKLGMVERIECFETVMKRRALPYLGEVK
jgi:hypothetical protein